MREFWKHHVVCTPHAGDDFWQHSERMASAHTEIALDAGFVMSGTGFEIRKAMRWFRSTLSVLAITLAGCASQQTSVAPVQHQPVYAEVYSTALAFDPPVIAGTP